MDLNAAAVNCTGNLSPSACVGGGLNATETPLPIYQNNWFRLIVLVPSIFVIIFCTVAIFILLRVRELHSVSNALIVNAAMADLLRGFIGIVLCEIFLFLHLAQSFWSNWSMVALAYDRYDLLSRPLNRRLGKKYVVVIIATIVTVALVFASLPIYSGWSDFLLQQMDAHPERAKCRYTHTETNTFDWIYQPTFDFLSFVVPAIFDVILYVMIAKMALRRRREAAIARCSTLGMTMYARSSLEDINSPENEESATSLETPPSPPPEIEMLPGGVIRTKAFRLVTIVIFTNLVLTFPFVFVAELEKFRVIRIMVFPDRIKSFLMTLFHCNFVVNSVVYLFWIRNALRIEGVQAEGRTARLLNACCL